MAVELGLSISAHHSLDSDLCSTVLSNLQSAGSSDLIGAFKGPDAAQALCLLAGELAFVYRTRGRYGAAISPRCTSKSLSSVDAAEALEMAKACLTLTTRVYGDVHRETAVAHSRVFDAVCEWGSPEDIELSRQASRHAGKNLLSMLTR